jgi:hypothetical protein
MTFQAQMLAKRPLINKNMQASDVSDTRTVKLSAHFLIYWFN